MNPPQTQSCLQEGSCLIQDVWFVFSPSCLQEGSCLIQDIWFVFSPSCLQEGSCLIQDSWFVFSLSCLQEGSCLIWDVCFSLYHQLFVGGSMFYLPYLCLFQSLPPVVCRRVHVLFTLFMFVLVSTSSCLQEGSFLLYVIDVCFSLYHQLFVGGLMSYLQQSSCHICRRDHVLFVRGFMSYLQQSSCHICSLATNMT